MGDTHLQAAVKFLRCIAEDPAHRHLLYQPTYVRALTDLLGPPPAKLIDWEQHQQQAEAAARAAQEQQAAGSCLDVAAPTHSQRKNSACVGLDRKTSLCHGSHMESLIKGETHTAGDADYAL